MNNKSTAWLLSLLLLAGAAMTACADTADTETDTGAAQNTAAAETDAETSEPDPFAEFDYGGDSVRIFTSINVASGVGNSNYLIEGPEEETGDIVNDSAYKRNRTVEELLNVDLVSRRLTMTTTHVLERSPNSLWQVKIFTISS